MDVHPDLSSRRSPLPANVCARVPRYRIYDRKPLPRWSRHLGTGKLEEVALARNQEPIASHTESVRTLEVVLEAAFWLLLMYVLD